MRKNSQDTTNQASRRRYLQSVGAIGLGGVFSCVTAGARSKTTKIVTDRANNEPIRTKEVPTKWLEFEKKATDVWNKLLEQHMSNSHVYSIGLGNSTERIGDLFKSKIKIRTEPNGPDLVLPNRVDDVPVSIQEEENTSSPDTCNTDEYTPVPGGVKIENSNAGGVGTLTTKVWDKYGNPGALTCAHMFDQNSDLCNRDLTGLHLSQSGNKMGEVPGQDYYNHDEDWVFLDKTGNETQGYEASIPGGANAVVAHKTKEGMRDLKSSNAEIHHMGRTSCESTGEITGVNFLHIGGSDSCFASDHAFETDINTSGGDSGGPFYQSWYDSSEYREEASIIGPLWGSTDTNSWGTGAHWIYGHYGISFTPK